MSLASTPSSGPGYGAAAAEVADACVLRALGPPPGNIDYAIRKQRKELRDNVGVFIQSIFDALTGHAAVTPGTLSVSPGTFTAGGDPVIGVGVIATGAGSVT